MLIEINGLNQGSIEVELQVIPRVGEHLKVLYGADAEVKGTVTVVEHYINQHDNQQKVILTIRPTN